MTLRLTLAALLACAIPAVANADPAPFDLIGPQLRITVTRGSATLPISSVPNLAAGDHIHVEADLPSDQSAHYLMVAAFLRGATNPPPKKWLTAAETWKRKDKERFLDLIVPEGARQLIVFLAPETGGDFDTLSSTVRGRPGAFVRASQDLNQASLDRSRLDTFLDGVRLRDPADPDRLETVSPLLARSLAIKFEASCLLKVPDLQAACLTQNRDSLVLADGHSSSITEALTGAPTDLALQLAATPQGGYGYYSPYIGVVRDVARILGAFQSAQFQYIPALNLRRGDRLSLLLNAPPSFNKPQSVIVTALPPVEPPQLPPLEPTTPDTALCIAQPGLVLPVDGAPLIYSTAYARQMAIRMQARDGRTLDVPVTADPEKGGYIVANGAIRPSAFAETVDATLHGAWGFQAFDGPRFRLENPQASGWKVAGDDQASLVVGRDNMIDLKGSAPACVESVAIVQPSGTTQTITWEARGADSLAVKVPLTKTKPGPVTLRIRQHGVAQDAQVTLTSYAEASRVDGLTLYSGDSNAILAGARLDEVAGVTLGDIALRPGAVTRVGDSDRLALSTDAPVAIDPGQTRTAKVSLRDGRTLSLKVTVAAPRPVATLIGKSIAAAPTTTPVALSLTSPDAVPQDARLTFSIRAEGATRFTGRETIEITTRDGTATTAITATNGLALEDPTVAVVAIEPGKALGPTAFGPLRFRVVQNGIAGDWQPLASLVRLPTLTQLACVDAKAPCRLTGAGLFLVAAVAGDAPAPTPVPQGFTGNALDVPHPKDGALMLTLRDDPQVQARVVAR